MYLYVLVSSDAGVCYDESEYCLQFANDGKCINSALHKFANFCKKACGLCGALSEYYTTECAKKISPNLKRCNFLNYECRNILLTQH